MDQPNQPRWNGTYALRRRLTDSAAMPLISGRIEVNLTVRDPVRSAAWYSELLGLEQRYDYTSDDGQHRYVVVQNLAIGFILGLVGHATNPGAAFNETNTGLDHLEFLVDSREDIDEWAARLDELGPVRAAAVGGPGLAARGWIRARRRLLAAPAVVPARLPRGALRRRPGPVALRALDVHLARRERERGDDGERAHQNFPSTKKSVIPAAAAAPLTA